MLKVLIKSYDSHFDTFACTFTSDSEEAFDSLLPASVIPYIARALCDECEDLPYDLIGKSFNLTHATA